VSFYGDLRTVSLTDLMRWASKNKKTGVLVIERNAICRQVEFRKGWVGSCSSNDPAARLGQFLLSRDRLTEIQLQSVLTLQRVTNKRLGLLLVEMNFITRADLACVVASKAQETIHSLFDWDDAFFRFDEGATLDPDQIEVNLSVEDLIAEGEKRCEQLDRIRRAFESSGVVLARTELEVPEKILSSRMMHRILDTVDGRRTIAEVLLQTRASDFPVVQFLHLLFERGMLAIQEVRAVSPDSPTLLDTRGHPSVASLDAPLVPGEVDRALLNMEPPNNGDIIGLLDEAIDRARQLIEQRSFDQAVELLRSTCREHSTDYARRLLLKAEAALVTSIREDGDFIKKAPALLHDRQSLSERHTAPEESFLLGLVDGATDVQSILSLAPMREIDVLLGLRRMMQKNLIELIEPSTEQPGTGS
jgi:hypothetical protein